MLEAMQRCWIASNSQDVRSMLDLLNRDGDRMATFKRWRHHAKWAVYDFTTLYTTLPHDHQEHGLKQRLTKLVHDIWNQDIRRNHWLVLSPNPANNGWRKGVLKAQGQCMRHRTRNSMSVRLMLSR